ncbi:MAG: TfoX/Sxy family protein [Candidatus Binatia bacterium]
MKNAQRSWQELKSPRPRRPPPLHQLTLEESIARLSLRGVTSRRMFGGLCYYMESKPFSIVLEDYFALKLPASQLRAGCRQGDGQLFNPGGGDFIMREYLALSHQALADEDRLDAYVLASYRFIAGQETPEGDLAGEDLWRGREGLYKKGKK